MQLGVDGAGGTITRGNLQNHERRWRQCQNCGTGVPTEMLREGVWTRVYRVAEVGMRQLEWEGAVEERTLSRKRATGSARTECVLRAGKRRG